MGEAALDGKGDGQGLTHTVTSSMVKIGSSTMTTTIGIKRKPEGHSQNVEKANPNATATPSAPLQRGRRARRSPKRLSRQGQSSR